mmetsp:Transcript_51440/g.111977  ORF Transcript_51440/g.111977 Transcript_51440/m.111977 type:complete len:217 (-) Transcript_51440:255-905(-)
MRAPRPLQTHPRSRRCSTQSQRCSTQSRCFSTGSQSRQMQARRNSVRGAPRMAASARSRPEPNRFGAWLKSRFGKQSEQKHQLLHHRSLPRSQPSPCGRSVQKSRKHPWYPDVPRYVDQTGAWSRPLCEWLRQRLGRHQKGKRRKSASLMNCEKESPMKSLHVRARANGRARVVVRAHVRARVRAREGVRVRAQCRRRSKTATRRESRARREMAPC